MAISGCQPPPSSELIARKLPRTGVIPSSDNSRPEAAYGDESIRFKRKGGRMSAVDIEGDEVEFSHRGPPPQNEEGSERVARELVMAINQRTVFAWPAPQRPPGPERGVDCECRSVEGTSLAIQVTRVAADRDVWRKMHTDGYAEGRTKVSALVEAVWRAIQNKFNAAGIGDICLALDARVSIEAAIPRVADAFKAAHGADLRSLGFQQVWLVGPLQDLIFRLDD